MKKKMNLKSLKVQSFVTSIDSANHLKGGTDLNTVLPCPDTATEAHGCTIITLDYDSCPTDEPTTTFPTVRCNQSTGVGG